MANSYNRQISLFINGKEIRNDVASISAEFRKLQNELKRTTIGSQEYQAKLGELQRVRGMLNDHNQQVKGTQSSVGKLKDLASGLLPAFGWAAIAAGATAAFRKIVSATDTLSTQWDIFMGGLKGATNEFWRTLATGEWSTFTTNMREAVKAGREYSSMMDDIEAKNRALTIAEAHSRTQELQLEEKLKNKGLTNQQRIEAGQERIRLEEKLAAGRVKVSKAAFDAEMMLSMQQSRLSKEQLMGVVSDMDSDLKTKAEAYNKLKDQVRGLESVNKPTYTGPGTVSMPSPAIGEKLTSLRAELESYPGSVKTYADALSGVGNITDEQLNKLVESYSKMIQAQDSAVENTKKVRTTVNGLLAETAKEAEAEQAKAAENQKKIIEGSFKDTQKSLTTNYTAELNLLKEKLLSGKLSQTQYNQESYILELAHLELMKGLYVRFGEETTALESQIIDKRLEFQKQLDELLKPSNEVEADLAKSDLDMFAQVSQEIDAYMADYKAKLDEQAKATIDSEAAKQAAIEATREAQVRSAAEAGIAAVENAETVEEAGKAVLNSIRGQIRAYIAEAVITAALKALKSVPFPFNIAAATIAGGAAAFLFNKLIPKFSEGGYTGGGSQEPAGIVHGGEYVVPKRMVDDPAVQPIVEKIEQVRSGKQDPDIFEAPQFAEGGFTGEGGTQEPAGVVHGGEYVVPKRMVDNPAISQILRSLEAFRMKRVHPDPQILNLPGFADGGFVGIQENLKMAKKLQFNPWAGFAVNKIQNDIMAELITLVKENTEASKKMVEVSEKNINATNKLMAWKPTVATTLIRRDLETLEDIEKNRGL